MNERIRELAEKAGERVVVESFDEYMLTETDDGASLTVPSEFIQQFAELIIKECIRVPYDMWDKAELNADVAVKIENRINNHFGIE